MMCGGQGSEEPGGGEDPKERRRRRCSGPGGAQGSRTGRNWRGGGGGAATQGPCPPTRPYLVQGQLQLCGAGRETAAASTSQPRVRLSPAIAAVLAPCATRGRAASGVWAAPGGSGRLRATPARLSSSTCCRRCRCASVPAVAPGTAAAYNVPPATPLPDAPIRRRATRARHRREGSAPAPWPKFGKG